MKPRVYVETSIVSYTDCTEARQPKSTATVSARTSSGRNGAR